jgi:methylmalonyl-CoA/ethylmalonyl-CoA epimerase
VKPRLNHIGLVVPDITEFARMFAIMGFDQATEAVPYDVQGVTASFVSVHDARDIHVEILEATREDSAISGFLKRRGAGLHHLCFEVNGLNEMVGALEQRGFDVVSKPADCPAYDESFERSCSNVTRVAFLLLAGKLLIELIEKGT